MAAKDKEKEIPLHVKMRFMNALPQLVVFTLNLDEAAAVWDGWNGLGSCRQLTFCNHIPLVSMRLMRFAIYSQALMIVSIGAGISRLEWRMQAVIAACNALPAVLFALAMAVLGFLSVLWAGYFGWIMFGFITVLILAYAVFCVIVGAFLWCRKVWALPASAAIFLFYIFAYNFLGFSSIGQGRALPGPAGLPAVHSFWPAIPAILHLLVFLNIAALVHLLMRWIRFRSEAGTG